jgi:H/ACA ribonucleoprotein complex subunit 3
MGKSILRCPKCNSYGLSQSCSCGGKRTYSHPPKFSVEDKYAKYRRQAKEQDNQTEN